MMLMERPWRRATCLGILAVLLLSAGSLGWGIGAAAAAPQAGANASSALGGELGAPLQRLFPEPQADPLGKLQPGLKDLLDMRPGGKLRVVVLTTDVVALGESLRASGISTPFGLRPSSLPMVPLILDLPAAVIPKLTSLPSVLHIRLFDPPRPAIVDSPFTETPRPTSLGLAPRTWLATQTHGAAAAWANGYTGEGVKVTVMDSGVDFAHPDLYNRTARDANPASPYYGWPIAFDPNSMYAWLVQGEAFPAAPASWYVDTSTNLTRLPTGALSASFNGHTYRVGPAATGIPSASGRLHLGLYPDQTLRDGWFAGGYGEYVAVLLTDSAVPYRYDTVYVDLDDNYDFTNDKPVRLGGNEISYADVYNATTGLTDTSSWDTGDGFPDLSGGMVYFIADGKLAVPYANVTAARNGLPNRIPTNGNLVAFMLSDTYHGGGVGEHGTNAASAVIAQNQTAYVSGFAPDADLIAVGDIYAGGFVYDIYYFAAEGYDGLPGSGDEAQIASLSFGGFDYDDGWDYEARLVDWISTVHAPTTTFVAASGNEGHGYGSGISPGSGEALISVGASTSYWGRDYTGLYIPDAFEPATQNFWGDVQPWSSRGPSAIGKGAPNVVAVGAWATGDNPVNMHQDGASAWTVWGGTSLSTPVTAGIVALIYEAYKDAHGGWPVSQLAKNLLMSGARNLHYDPLTMGAGHVDAERSTLLAANRDGVLVVPYAWNPGSSGGVERRAFTNILFPGQSDDVTVVLFNENKTVATTATVSDQVLQRMAVTWMNFTARNSRESAYSFTRPDYLFPLINRTTGFSVFPAGTNLVKVTLFHDYATFDPNGDYVEDSIFRLLLYDWLDVNANGKAWTDTNGNGAVNANELETAPQEIIRTTYGYTWNNFQQVLIHDPLARVNTGLFLGVQHRISSNAVATTDLKIKLESFKTVDASWLSESAGSVPVPANGAASFTATATVPLGTPPGLYEAAIIVNVSGQETVVPVTLLVASPTPDFVFGGAPDETVLYDNSRLFDGIDWGESANMGDYRFFFLNVTGSYPTGPGHRLLIETTWDQTPTDIDTYLLGGVPDPFSAQYPGTYGPNTLEILGGSLTVFDGYAYQFQTTSGEARELVGAQLSSGLNEIILHNVLYAGAPSLQSDGSGAPFSGRAGRLDVSPDPWLATTTQTTGRQEFTARSMLGFADPWSVLAFGLSTPQVYADQPIVQGQDVFRTFTVASAGWLEVTTSSADPVDIDLYLYRQVGNTWVPVGASYTPYAYERIVLQLPPDGTYLADVYGYAVPVPATFDLSINVIQGTDLVVSDLPGGPIVEGATARFNVSYTLPPASGDYYGIIYLGPSSAPTAVAIPVQLTIPSGVPPWFSDWSPANQTLVVDPSTPISVSYAPGTSFDAIDVDAVRFWLDEVDLTNLSTITDASLLYDAFPLSESLHTARVSIADLRGLANSTSWSFTVDSVAPTLSLTAPTASLINQTSVVVAGTTEVGARVWVEGVEVTVDGSGGFSRTVTLAEGPNLLDVLAQDAAGNTATAIRLITRDTIAPLIAVEFPALVGSTPFALSGTTEPGVTLTLNGAPLTVGPDGAFVTSVPLNEGANTLLLVATDAAGNRATLSGTVVLDSLAPTVVITSPSSGALLATRLVTVAGTTEPFAQVLVNDVGTTADGGGSFSVQVGLGEGPTVIAVVATDMAGHSGTDSVSVVVDTIPPLLSLESPRLESATEVNISGTTEAGATVSVGGRSVVAAADGSFAFTVEITVGTPSVTVEARDAAGNRNTQVLSLEGAEAIRDLRGLNFGLSAALIALVAAIVGLLFLLLLRARKQRLGGGGQEPPLSPPPAP